MNNNFLNIIKRIVAEQGEVILGDANKLKVIVKDYAKNEPKEDRVAFGRCIEAGCYNELKRAATPQERGRLKLALSKRVASASGINPAHCAAALDIIEAVISAAPQSEPLRSSASSWLAKLSRKTIVFGIAAGVGAFAGEMVSEFFRLNRDDRNILELILSIALWAAFLGLGISVGLLVAQSIYLKKKSPVSSLVKTALLGIAIGAIAGGSAQVLFAYTYNISTAVEIISRVFCWGILGWGIGWGVSFFVPNFPVKRAMLAGLLGGLIGGAVFRSTFFLPDPLGRFIGVIILGFFIGLAISYIEEALREAWLTIIWGPKETTTVALGAKQVSFGSSREADVYLPRRRGEPEIPPIRAVFNIENGRIVMEDRLTNQRSELHGGSQVDLGRVNVVVHTKSST